MNVFVVFDDTCGKSEIIKDVIGEKGFADVVVRKKTLADYYHERVTKLYPKNKWHVVYSVFGFHDLFEKIKELTVDHVRILHCFANYIISDEKKVLLSYEKLQYIDDDYRVMSNRKIAAVMFHDLKSYLHYLSYIREGKTSIESAELVENYFTIEGLTDIGIVSNFIQCITGNFESRYFNSLRGDEYTIIKSSENKKKIESEYRYYHLLPDDMKMWYVMPFHYQEDEQSASYTMERMHMTDLSVKWVHGSIGEIEFEEILDKYFFFFRTRHKKNIPYTEYKEMAGKLYYDKVMQRIEKLKKHKAYEAIKKFIDAGCDGNDIDLLVKKYLHLKDIIENKNEYPAISVIGHGDSCFANTLYSRSTKTLKFIDPKGAMEEKELWINPYYDVAKLSHSVCGRYDFFNNALYDIRVNEHFECELLLEFDNTRYVDLFKKKLEENGYDYQTVRIYEVSLFLSMLPLHMDYPHKVLGFILNIQNILKEIEKDVQ